MIFDDDLHEHECFDPKCAMVWSHTSLEALFNAAEAHRCPKCGKFQFFKRKYVQKMQKGWDRQRKQYKGPQLKRRVRYILSRLDPATRDVLKKAKLEPICTLEAEFMVEKLKVIEIYQ